MRNFVCSATVALLVALAFISTADAIQCHKCAKEGCLKSASELDRSECSSLLSIRTCMTVFADDSQEKILYKDCGLPMMKQNECKTLALPDFGLKLGHACFCDSDLCNSAPLTLSSSLLLVALLSAVCLFAGRL